MYLPTTYLCSILYLSLVYAKPSGKLAREFSKNNEVTNEPSANVNNNDMFEQEEELAKRNIATDAHQSESRGDTETTFGALSSENNESITQHEVDNAREERSIDDEVDSAREGKSGGKDITFDGRDIFAREGKSIGNGENTATEVRRNEMDSGKEARSTGMGSVNDGKDTKIEGRSPGYVEEYFQKGKFGNEDDTAQREGRSAGVGNMIIDETLPDRSDFDVLEGDILVKKSKITKNLVLSEYQLWPNKTVYYNFADAEFTLYERKLVEDAIEDLRLHTCVRFVPRTNQETWVRFRTSGLGCAGPVGYFPIRGGIDVFLGGSYCFQKGKIQHEILHTLGFWHEHTRPDRDYYIRVLEENISPGRGVNMEKRPTGTVRTFGLPYDYGSIMHYSDTAFSKDGFSRTIVPLYPGADGIIGQRDAMSKVDLAKVNRLYKCSKDYYLGYDITGYYSTDGPIPDLGYLPANSGWFYKIGPPMDSQIIGHQFFNNTVHFGNFKPGADPLNERVVKIKGTNIPYVDDRNKG